jgi:hypothetical protein
MRPQGHVHSDARRRGHSHPEYRRAVCDRYHVGPHYGRVAYGSRNCYRHGGRNNGSPGHIYHRCANGRCDHPGAHRRRYRRLADRNLVADLRPVPDNRRDGRGYSGRGLSNPQQREA